MGPANPDFEINIEARNCFATTRSRNAREGGTRRGMRESEKLSNYPSFFARDRWERFRSVVGARARSSREIEPRDFEVHDLGSSNREDWKGAREERGRDRAKKGKVNWRDSINLERRRRRRIAMEWWKREK